uniref:Major capsid protein n=1 Tax=Dulem virus 165 TaxID=3145642 RepID=A0AAU8B5X9_9VIRU
MNHLFSEIPKAQIPRSSFDRSSSYRTTFRAGYLIPVYLDEVLPGDTFNMTHNFLCRLTSPLSVPLMDTLYLDMFYFFVPTRLVWENWERMHGAQDYPGASTDYQVPLAALLSLTGGTSAAKDLADPDAGSGLYPLVNHMGVATATGDTSLTSDPISVLPLRCYWLIWNEWFRDQNLQSAVKIDTSDGPQIGTWFDSSTAFYSTLTNPTPPGGSIKQNLLNFPAPSAKLHDYFTSALPFPQKGPGVEISLSGNAPVLGNGLTLGLTAGSAYGNFGLTNLEDNGANTLRAFANTYGEKAGIASTTVSQGLQSVGVGLTTDKTKSGVIADMSSVTAVTINSLRQAFQLQKLYERDARGGTRYKEILLAHYGVVSPDARLQRPEYLGGFSEPITVNTVAQTAEGENAPLGNLGAFATARVSRHGFTKSFTEFGYILGIARVRSVPSYQQGVGRLWFRKTRTDFYYPVFAHLGEQPIYLKEIYNIDDEPVANSVFGYQERYAELRYKPSRITGAFNSLHSQSLDLYHLGQLFSSKPGLNSEFIQDRPPIERAVAVGSSTDQSANADQFLFDAYYQLKCVREMPLYGTPELVDHF